MYGALDVKLSMQQQQEAQATKQPPSLPNRRCVDGGRGNCGAARKSAPRAPRKDCTNAIGEGVGGQGGERMG